MIQGIIGLGLLGGAGFQLFKKSTDNADATFDSVSARDSYFTDNPGDLTTLNSDQFKIIKLLNNGSGSVAYQQREFIGSVYMWKDVTSLVTGPMGSAANLSNVSTGHIPVKSLDGVSFGDSGIRLENGQLITSMDIVGNEVISSLNSFKLAKQHTVSSGAENVFFTNNTSNIHFFPTWQGQTAYDWTEASNSVIRASERVYGDIVQFTLGTENIDGPAIPLVGTRTTTTNISYYGIRFRIKEDYTGKLTYRSIDSPTGVVLFETIQDVDAVDGDMVEIRFSDIEGANAPLELQAGENLSRSVTKEDGTPVLTTASNVGADVNYLEFPFRVFSDKRIALLEDIGYSLPAIGSFNIEGQHTQVDAGTTLSGVETFNYVISNEDNVEGSLTLTQDGVELLSGIDSTATSVDVTVTAITLASGQSTTFILSGEATNGTSFSQSLTIRARVQSEALYYGVTTSATVIDETVLTEHDIVSGSVFNADFDIPSGSYAVILSPATIEVVSILELTFDQESLDTFTKVEDAKVIGGQSYDSYVRHNQSKVQGVLSTRIGVA